jgi:hypothetical protein
MANVPILGQRQQQPTDPVFRLLHCLVCDTLEELPPYEGPSDQDTLLEIACEVHIFPSGEPHKGKLYVLPLKYWAKTESKREIIRQIKGGGSKGLAELDETYYDSRSTFMDDAMACYRQHNKPKEGCDDWHSKHKMLVPKTAKERKAEGMARYQDEAGPKTYLCDFCPVAVAVNTRKRKLLGGLA